MSSRYDHASLILTANLSFSDWAGVFGGQAVAVAMIDRVVHQGEVLALKGAGYRFRGRGIDSPQTSAPPLVKSIVKLPKPVHLSSAKCRQSSFGDTPCPLITEVIFVVRTFAGVVAPLPSQSASDQGLAPYAWAAIVLLVARAARTVSVRVHLSARENCVRTWLRTYRIPLGAGPGSPRCRGTTGSQQETSSLAPVE